jgi:hypothetical protein
MSFIQDDMIIARPAVSNGAAASAISPLHQDPCDWKVLILLPASLLLDNIAGTRAGPCTSNRAWGPNQSQPVEPSAISQAAPAAARAHNCHEFSGLLDLDIAFT